MMQSIAHDLRSPLATISGSLELYEKAEETDRTGHIDNIRYASGYMLSLVDTLMEYYQLDTGLLHLHPSIFHLETLFCEIADSHIPAARKRISAFSLPLPAWIPLQLETNAISSRL